MPDFNALLSKSVDSAVPPPALPVGTYKGLIGKHDFDESSKKKTPYVRFKIKPTEALEDVDQALFAEYGGDAQLQKAELKTDFYLTDDALFRLRDFLENKCKLSCEGRSFSEVIPETQGVEVIIGVKQSMSQDGSTTYAEIGSIAASE